MSTLINAIQYLTEDSKQCTKGRKRSKVIQIGKKEVKLFSFTDDITLYRENPRIHKKKLLKVINKSETLQDEKSVYNILMFDRMKNLIKKQGGQKWKGEEG